MQNVLSSTSFHSKGLAGPKSRALCGELLSHCARACICPISNALSLQLSRVVAVAGCQHWTWLYIWHCFSSGFFLFWWGCCQSRKRNVSGSQEIPDSSRTGIGANPAGLPAMHKSCTDGCNSGCELTAPSEISAACTCPHLDPEFPGQNHRSVFCLFQHAVSKELFVSAFSCAGSGPLLR